MESVKTPIIMDEGTMTYYKRHAESVFGRYQSVPVLSLHFSDDALTLFKTL